MLCGGDILQNSGSHHTGHTPLLAPETRVAAGVRPPYHFKAPLSENFDFFSRLIVHTAWSP